MRGDAFNGPQQRPNTNMQYMRPLGMQDRGDKGGNNRGGNFGQQPFGMGYMGPNQGGRNNNNQPPFGMQQHMGPQRDDNNNKGFNRGGQQPFGGDADIYNRFPDSGPNQGDQNKGGDFGRRPFGMQGMGPYNQQGGNNYQGGFGRGPFGMQGGEPHNFHEDGEDDSEEGGHKKRGFRPGQQGMRGNGWMPFGMGAPFMMPWGQRQNDGDYGKGYDGGFGNNMPFGMGVPFMGPWGGMGGQYPGGMFGGQGNRYGGMQGGMQGGMPGGMQGGQRGPFGGQGQGFPGSYGFGGSNDNLERQPNGSVLKVLN